MLLPQETRSLEPSTSKIFLSGQYGAVRHTLSCCPVKHSRVDSSCNRETLALELITRLLQCRIFDKEATKTHFTFIFILYFYLHTNIMMRTVTMNVLPYIRNALDDRCRPRRDCVVLGFKGFIHIHLVAIIIISISSVCWQIFPMVKMCRCTVHVSKGLNFLMVLDVDRGKTEIFFGIH